MNSGFTVALQGLALLRTFSVAAFISVEDLGVWGILGVGLSLLGWIANAGVDAKFVQQDEEDQVRAFQKAFTVQLQLMLVLTVLAGLSLLLIVPIYDEPRIVAPGLVIIATVPLVALQAPLWVFGRDLDYLRQRLIMAADPVVTIVVTTVLAATGSGYWSLVIGMAAGRVALAAVCVACSPYPIRIRREAGTLKEYWTFSWPVMAAGGVAMVIPQSTTVVADLSIGLAAVGAMTLAHSYTQFTDRVDRILTQTMYPALCAAKDRTGVLQESFVKSNRLGMMWAVPLGVGLACFSPDLVDYVIGDRWDDATILLQTFGVAAAIGHVGFNWGAYYMVHGETRQFFTNSWVLVVVYVVLVLPLMVAFGLAGLGVGMILHSVLKLPLRAYYVRRLFPTFRMLHQAVRGFAPAVPAVGVVLLLRLLEPGVRTGGVAAAELGVFLLVFGIATYVFERPLLREVLGYFARAHRPARLVTS